MLMICSTDKCIGDDRALEMMMMIVKLMMVVISVFDGCETVVMLMAVGQW